LYHPTGRVLTVLELLQSRPGLTGPELASRLETDVRTVRRYVSKLKDVGIPVEASPGCHGGYRLRPGFKLPPLIFSEPEATAIVLGLLGSSWLEIEQPPEAVEGALSKITRVMPEAARQRVLAMSSVMFLSPYRDDSRPDASMLILLGDAIQARRCVSIRYQSERGELTERTVEPYGLVGRQGKWYLVGWCRLRVDYRTFRLDRVKQVEPTVLSFVRNEEFDFRAYAKKQLETWPVNWHALVVFPTTMARVRERIPASLGTLTETPEGVALDWPVDDLDYVARYLVSRFSRFTVMGPPELRTALQKLAEQVRGIAEQDAIPAAAG
jgi:predicted DNA-binding transcriptional regulator YafY